MVINMAKTIEEKVKNKTAGRPRKEDNPNYSLGGLGLKNSEEKKLLPILLKKEISIKALCRRLIREWLTTPEAEI